MGLCRGDCCGSPRLTGLVHLEAQQLEWGDLGIDACMALALHYQDLIGQKYALTAMPAVLSDANSCAKRDYPEVVQSECCIRENLRILECAIG